MSDLRMMYNRLRQRGYRHFAAMRQLAREIGVDDATIERTLSRAGAIEPKRQRPAPRDCEAG